MLNQAGFDEVSQMEQFIFWVEKHFGQKIEK